MNLSSSPERAAESVMETGNYHREMETEGRGIRRLFLFTEPDFRNKDQVLSLLAVSCGKSKWRFLPA
jgi:hypothetical protein